MIIVGLGGNVGGDDAILERFRRARDALGPCRSAPLYRSSAIGPAQADYLNTAVRLAFAGGAAELIATLHELELLLGRDRRGEQRWGPRAIDLDVLAWDGRVIREPIEVPHPRIGERRFALEPLIALVGEDYELPGLGRAGDLLARVRDQRVDVVSESW